MANDHIVARAMIVLELPDGGIPRTPGGPGATYAVKADSEIINEIIQQGISGTNWSSDGIKKPGPGMATLTLVHGGA